MRRRGSMAFNLALQSISRKPLRALCLMGLVALSTFALTGGTLLAFGLSNGTRSVSQRLGADAMLVPAGYEANAEGALLRGEPSAFWFDAALADSLMASDGIARATPQIFLASFDSEHCDAAVQMIGYDPATDFVIAPWLSTAVPGGLGDGEIIIGSAINGKLGGSLTFFAREYTVAGRLAPTGMGFDTSVFINLDTAGVALGDYLALGGTGGPPVEAGAVSSIAVDLRPGVTPEDFARGVRYGFRTEGVGVLLTQAMLGGIAHDLDALVAVIGVIIAVLWLATVGVLAILFSVTVNERGREFGVYRALGATRRKLAGFVVTESSVLSAAGAAVGIALLALVYLSFGPLLSQSINTPYLQPSAAAIAAILGGGFAVSLASGPAASLGAAAKIGRLATYAVLRGDTA